MATAAGDLVVRLGAQTRGFDRKMRGVRGTLAATKTAVYGLGAAITTALGPVVGVYGLYRLARAGEEFNRKMRASLAIMGDVSQALRQDMRRAAFEVAKATKFSAGEAAEAFYFLASAGLDAQRSIGALPQVAQFAQAGNFGLARATELAVGAQAAMGLKSADAAENLQNLNRVTDVLVKANTLAQASVEEFAVALGTDAANAARMSGQSIEEVVAILAAFAEKMVKGEKAGSAYARAINYLSIQATENTAAFKRAGVEMFDLTGGTRTLVDVIADLEKRFAGMSDRERTVELLTLGFTKKTIALMNTLIGTSDQVRKFTEILREAGGTTREVAAKQLTPFQKGWAKLSAVITDVGARLMDWAGPKLGRAMSAMADWSKGVRVAFVLLHDLVRSVTQFFVDAFLIGFDYVKGLLAPFQGSFLSAFRVVTANLDVLLGSWEGLREGIVHASRQAAFAFMATWETVRSFMEVKITQLIGLFDKLLSRYLQVAARIVLEYNMWKQGVPEEMKGPTRKGFELAFGADRQKIEEQTNKEIERQEKEHQKRIAGIGKNSIEETRKWQERLGTLPRLSDRVRELWKEATKAAAAAGAPTIAAPGLPGGAGAGAPGAVPKYAEAMERGQAKAQSAILAAMRPARDPQKEIAKEVKRGADAGERGAAALERIEDKEADVVPIPG